MKEVVKAEVIKLLDAGMIYPISDSPWCHNGFRSTLMTTKINGVATDLFCMGVIGHPVYIFLN